MIRIINITMGHKVVNIHAFTKKLVIDPEKKQFAIVCETKTIPGFFEGIVQETSK